MSSFRSLRRSEAGATMISLIALVAIATLSVLFLQMSDSSISAAKGKLGGSRYTVMLESAADTMLLAYRLAEMSYNLQMAKCTGGQVEPFLTALKQGHGCSAGVTDVIVFSPDDLSNAGQDATQIASMYSYVNGSGGCKIQANVGLTCAGQAMPVPLINIGVTTPQDSSATQQRIDGGTYVFTMSRILTQKQIAELSIKITSSGGAVTHRSMAIRATTVNMAHIEADGRVTQENPDPDSKCTGSPWATMPVYDTKTHKCQQYAQVGGGTGLAYFNGRFFGFRPPDGMVVDLLAASTDPSYLVDPTTGCVCSQTPCPSGCDAVFPPYEPTALRNTDDITVIGTSVKNAQIYYVQGQGDTAVIGGISYDGSTQPLSSSYGLGQVTPVPICPLGAQGWGQAYQGIAALDWDDQILPTGSTTAEKIATFLLKTDTGSMLTATVVSGQLPVPASFSQNSCFYFTYGGSEYWSCCQVALDTNLQQVEYRRSLGFDRAAKTLPYYLY